MILEIVKATGDAAATDLVGRNLFQQAGLEDLESLETRTMPLKGMIDELKAICSLLEKKN